MRLLHNYEVLNWSREVTRNVKKSESFFYVVPLTYTDVVLKLQE